MLRGINVGGKNILPMSRLRSILSDAGFENVQTYIQSGNVIFYSPRQPQSTLEKKIERVLKKQGFNIKTLVLTESQLSKIIERAPKVFQRDKHTHLCDVIFLMKPLTTTSAIRSLTVR